MLEKAAPDVLAEAVRLELLGNLAEAEDGHARRHEPGRSMSNVIPPLTQMRYALEREAAKEPLNSLSIRLSRDVVFSHG